MISTAIMLFAAAVSGVHYDCTISDTSAAGVTDGAWKRVQPRFPGMESGPWRFTIDTIGGSTPKATVVWDKDFANIAGSATMLPIAEGVFAFVVAKKGGCLFAQNICLATVEVADVGKDKAHIAVTPVGLKAKSADGNGPMDILQVSLLGECTRSAGGRQLKVRHS